MVKKHTEETKKKISDSLKGEKHIYWKGDRASYPAIHTWLIRNHGKATHCENPKCNKKSKIYEWSLKKGYKHSHNIKHYLQLCKSCHHIYDMTDKIRKKISESNKGRIISEEHKKILSKRMKKDNPSFGGLSKEHKEKISKNHSRHNKGIPMSEERKEHLRKMYKGKTYEEIHGVKKAKEIKLKLKKNHIRNK